MYNLSWNDFKSSDDIFGTPAASKPLNLGISTNGAVQQIKEDVSDHVPKVAISDFSLIK